MYLGILTILSGGLLWYMEEKNALLNWTILSSILLLVIGAFLMIGSIEEIFKKSRYEKETVQKINLYTWHWFYIIGLIFIGSVFYTLAAYLHLKMDQWTFLKALLIAIPFVFIEYQFILRGNYYAKQHLLMNTVQITVLTMIFYFFNAFLLNYFIIQQPIIVWRETLSIFFVFMAFLTTTSI